MSSAVPEDETGPGDLYAARRLPEIADRWDAKAERWDLELQKPSCHLNEDGAYERFLELANATAQNRREFCAVQGVIDVGCATGLVLAKAIVHFAWGIGLDISPRMISMARAKGIPRASFLVGDCFDFAATNPKAGAVLSRGVLLSHYGREHAGALLHNARSALVPGGFLLWDFLNRGGRGKYLHAPLDKAYFEPDELRAIALGVGFRAAECLGAADCRVGLLLAEAG